jgi:hypothetical protein
VSVSGRKARLTFSFASPSIDRKSEILFPAAIFRGRAEARERDLLAILRMAFRVLTKDSVIRRTGPAGTMRRI